MILSAKDFKEQTSDVPATKSTSGKVTLTFVGVDVKVTYTRRIRTLIHAANDCCPDCGAKFSHLELSKHYLGQKLGQTKRNKPKPFVKVVPYGIRKDGTKVEMNSDHIVPQNRGGNHHTDNLQLMCVQCNSKKSNKLPSEIIMGKNWWKKLTLIKEEV